MDTEGARALARRIAEGKPSAETTLAEGRTGDAGARIGPAPRSPDALASSPAGDDVVYVRPRRILGHQNVWIYVRGRGGRLYRLH